MGEFAMQKCPKCGAIYEADQKSCPQDGSELVPFILNDRYKLLRKLGAGGMGAVYAAEHTQLGKKVAVKLLLAMYAKIEEFQQRFEREARTTSKLTHLNCLQVSDFGVAEEGPYLVMEYLEGRSLGEAIHAGRIERSSAVEISRQILSALAHAHSLGIVHRDLKPDNVFMVTQAGARGDFCKILDFGLAKLMRDTDKNLKLTGVGIAVGTPAYMAPEQCIAEETDHRVDLYAMGVVMYELFLGRRPFLVTDAQDILRAHVLTEPDAPRAIDPSISEALAGVMRKALAKSKEDRHQSAEDFLHALNETPEGKGIFPTLPQDAQAKIISEEEKSTLREFHASDIIEMGGPSLIEKMAVEKAALAAKEPKRDALAEPLEAIKRSIKKVNPTVAIGVAAVLLLVVIVYSFTGDAPPPQPTPAPISKPVAATAPTEPVSPWPQIVLEDDRSTLQAEEYLRDGNLSAAGRELMRLLKAEPKNARVHYLHGIWIYKDSKKLWDTATALSKAVELDQTYAYDEILRKLVVAAFDSDYGGAIITSRNLFTKTMPKDIAIETLRDCQENGGTPKIRRHCTETLKAVE
jgi:serine/threonine protein kinase